MSISMSVNSSSMCCQTKRLCPAISTSLIRILKYLAAFHIKSLQMAFKGPDDNMESG